MTDLPTPLSKATKVLALRASLAGRQAALQGRAADTCPFQLNATAEDAADAGTVAEATVERYLARMWHKGWTKGSTETAAAQ